MTERTLQDFVQEVNGENHLRIEHDYGDGFVRLKTSEAERRQAAQDIQCSEDIVLELLRNSRDAHASHVFLAVSKEGTRRRIAVIDDGDGIPKSMHELVFEPRVTSKLDTSHMDAWGLHGRGMALFSIAQNALSAHVVESSPDRGCAMVVETDTVTLREKRDQSGFPRFVMDDEGTVNVRGPKNIVRTACEFAIEARSSCSVYYGSPAEIVSSLYAFGKSSLSAVERAFCKDVASLPIVKRLATASEPSDLAAMASLLGLEISERTARRVIDGQIADVPSLLDCIVIEGVRETPQKKRGSRRNRKSIKLQDEDKRLIAESAREGFSVIAERYYLEKAVEPEVRVFSDKVTITIPVITR